MAGEARRSDAPIEPMLDALDKDYGGDLAEYLGGDWREIAGQRMADAWLDGYTTGRKEALS